IVRSNKRTAQIHDGQRSLFKLPDITNRLLGLLMAFGNHSSRLEEGLKDVQSHLQWASLASHKLFVFDLSLELVVIKGIPALVSPGHITEDFHDELELCQLNLKLFLYLFSFFFWG